MLTDPRQRRFFKPKDIRDLFTLGDEDEHGTETGDIFAGTGAKEVKLGDLEATKDDGANDKSDQNEGKGNATLLNSLLEDVNAKALHSMMNHDDIIGAGTAESDAQLIEYEADRAAEDAFEEVKRSAEQRRRQGVAVPTWTGRSGLAGITGTGRSGSGAFASISGAGESSLSKGSSLLQKIKAREGKTTAQENGQASVETPPGDDQKPIMEDLLDFFKERNGECTSNEVVERFRERVERSGENVQVFKSMLKRVAKLKKGAGPNGTSVWKLNADIRT